VTLSCADTLGGNRLPRHLSARAASTPATAPAADAPQDTNGFHAQFTVSDNPAGEVGASGKLDASQQSWHDTLVYWDRFRQDRFALVCFVLLLAVLIVCVTVGTVMTGAQKRDYHKVWPRKAERRRGGKAT
jgi:hypothetical protein